MTIHRIALLTLAPYCLALSFPLPSHAQTTQAEAFKDGKAYKSLTPAIKSGINASAMDNVPGQDMVTTNELKGLYGTTLKLPGQNKIVACSTYTPGTDAYKNAECDTINFVSGNPDVRPKYTIDKVADPILIRSTLVRNTPEANTTGTPGLTGAYTACTNLTTHQPERFDTERCQIGRPVTPAECSATLKVTYAWERYAAQAGADLRYAICSTAEVRGDRLTIPLTDEYRTQTTLCSDSGHGSGVEYKYWYKSCTGSESLHGFDASACSSPPSPPVVNPPRKDIEACANAPRTAENCFIPDGHFTTKAQVPVFKDNWDNSACADLNSHGAVIVN